jgi:hypothetical protein
MATYRAAYIGQTVLTGLEHTRLSDDALLAEARAEAERASLLTDDPSETAAPVGAAILRARFADAVTIGLWTDPTISDIALLRAAIAASGLSARRYATEVLTRDERTVRRWLAGESPIPQAVLRYLQGQPRA